MNVQLNVCTHSATALGISSRFGASKITHLAARLLRLQKAVRSKVLTVVKIRGESNRADVMTKPLDPARLSTLLGLLPMKKPHSKGEMDSTAVPRTVLAGLLMSCTLLVQGTDDTAAQLRRDDSTDMQCS